MDSFDDIRPYSDDEVASVLHRLVRDEQLLNAVGHFQYAGLPAFVRNLLRPFISWRLRQMVDGVHDVEGLQHSIKPMLEQVIRQTTENLTWSGVENLPADRPFLLLSNHRDIVMDPALVDFALYQQGLKTARIAIGDNLLGRPYVSDLMRLNKSFIVQRSIAGRREKLKAFQQLSAYISHSIEDGETVWMAHREGRAKDGDDRTDTAILKMLYMSFRHDKRSLSEMLEHLSIIPVSISYEYDPCDIAKAMELQERETSGGYSKEQDEDLNSIVTGIEGKKGRVHVAFGQVIDPTLPTPQAVAESIDRQMHRIYRLWPSNWLARDILAGTKCNDWQEQYSSEELVHHEALFHDRLAQCPETAKEWFLKSYANPVYNRLRGE